MPLPFAQPLVPGRYFPEEFPVDLSFAVGEGWTGSDACPYQEVGGPAVVGDHVHIAFGVWEHAGPNREILLDGLGDDEVIDAILGLDAVVTIDMTDSTIAGVPVAQADIQARTHAKILWRGECYFQITLGQTYRLAALHVGSDLLIIHVTAAGSLTRRPFGLAQPVLDSLLFEESSAS